MTTTPKLPASGGSWIRKPDGTLQPAENVATPPLTNPDAPVSTARKGAKKEL